MQIEDLIGLGAIIAMAVVSAVGLWQFRKDIKARDAAQSISRGREMETFNSEELKYAVEAHYEERYGSGRQGAKELLSRWKEGAEQTEH